MSQVKEKIAVIGMANVFPGSETPAAFWQQLLEKGTGKSDATREDMLADPLSYLGNEGDTDKYYCLKGGFIRDFDFAGEGFAVAANKLEKLDHLYHLALTVSRNALRDAGYWQSDRLADCGVLLGNLSFPTKTSNDLFMPIYRKAYEAALADQGIHLPIAPFQPEVEIPFENGLIAGFPSSLIATACGLGGTHYSLDAACASSCYSVQLACQYLQTGRAKMMLAGAVSAADPMFIHMGFSIFHAFPGNQVHAPFDRQSEGLFAGEGAGMLVLKPLSAALNDGDTIHAVIEGGGLSNDGKGEFVLSPNPKGQVLAFERAYREANVSPADVQYVECHATGTPKGDKVELQSMQTFFEPLNAKPLLGSAKSNLGHLLTAAGMPSMMKVIYGLQQGKLPATVNVNDPIASKDGYFGADQIVTETTDWPETTGDAKAAVSVFGFGGSNAHLVFGKAEDTTPGIQPLNPKRGMAIVGMDAHFGTTDTLEKFQSLVVSGDNNFVPLPESRWKGFEDIPGLLPTPTGGFIERFEMDFLHFKIPPNEDDSLIPQQLLMMKVADNAVRRAGLAQGANVAVLVAMGIEPELHQYRGRVNMHTQIEQTLKAQGIALTEEETQQLTESLKDSLAGAAGLNQYTSFIGNIMASRLSSLWDFSGPALTISAEENSVFRALELAETLFETLDVEAVVVAGVDLAGSFENVYLRTRLTGVDNPGFKIGEGAGAIVLKPETVAEGCAIIRGLASDNRITGESIQRTGQQVLGLSGSQPAGIQRIETGKTLNATTLQALYPEAVFSNIDEQIGNTCNAQGIAALIASVIHLKAQGSGKALIHSEGVDNTLTQMVIDASSEPVNTRVFTQEKSLIKTIRPGGDPIKSRFSDLLPPALKIRLQQKTQRKEKVSAMSPTEVSDSPIDYSALQQQQLKTHEVFLALRAKAQRQIEDLIKGALHPAASGLPVQQEVSDSLYLPERYNQPEQVIFDQQALVIFAEGDISDVFGAAYKELDQYERRVRLPTTDYLLVTRVTDLEATLHEYKPSYMATEYDIPTDAPFLVDGQIPWSVSVESGQCDLMLISYIGIDFKAKSERVYRLLDCELTFLEDMAFGGQTLRYEIHIDSYARNGDQLLFFFHYDCFVEGKKVLIMRGGCAGFFTDEELDEGKGVILTDDDKAQLANAKKQTFTPLIANNKTAYNYQDMLRLVHGDIAGCLGAAYDQGSRNPSLQFSSEKFLMIEHVDSIDPKGGHWGLGVLYGRKRLESDHWYFPCHFKGDQVMAGSLMSEGCGQLAMFYMLWLGMHSDVNNARFQPVPGASQKVRCRGQVTPQSNDLIYRMEVTSISMAPYPTLSANIDIILDGKVVVDFKNLSVMIKEQAADSPYARQVAASPIPSLPETDETGKMPFKNVNAPLMWVETDRLAEKIKGVAPIKHVEAPLPTLENRKNRQPDTLPFTPWHLFEFATGDIAKCFGEEYRIYEGRIPPRTPCGDLQLVTEVVAIEGRRHDLKKQASCTAHYEVPSDAWYFEKNSHASYMPYSVMMEIALQPNGFISGFMGTTLAYPDKDLFFRNLDGQGELIRDVDLRGKTITNHSVMLSTSMAGGSIIQSFTFDLGVDGETFYRGTAVFGYFSRDALTNQLGIDNGQLTGPWFEGRTCEKQVLDLTDETDPLFLEHPNKPHYRLSRGQLNFLDQVTVVKEGGDFGLGYLYGERTIDPSDWFFRYHFHQDPVMPGSLGVEAMIELLKVYAIENDLGARFSNPRFIAPKTTVNWKYRGQITPENRLMTVDIHVKSVEESDGQVVILADANLSKDNLRIYQVSNLALALMESE